MGWFGDGLLGAVGGFANSMAQSTREQALLEMKEEVERARMEAVRMMQREEIEWKHQQEEEWRRDKASELQGLINSRRDSAGKEFDDEAEYYRNMELPEGANREEILAGIEKNRAAARDQAGRDYSSIYAESGNPLAKEMLAVEMEKQKLADARDERRATREENAEIKRDMIEQKREQAEMMYGANGARRRDRGQGGSGAGDNETKLMAQAYTARIKELADDKTKPSAMLKLEPEQRTEAEKLNRKIDEDIKIMRNSALLVSSQKLRTQVMNDLASEIASIKEMPRSDGLVEMRKLKDKLESTYDLPLVNQMLSPFRDVFDEIYRRSNAPNDGLDSRDISLRSMPKTARAPLQMGQRIKDPFSLT